VPRARQPCVEKSGRPQETIEQLAPDAAFSAALLSLVSVLIDIVHDVRRARAYTKELWENGGEKKNAPLRSR
jgi:hypothetical protein